jgi:hypothetical protein
MADDTFTDAELEAMLTEARITGAGEQLHELYAAQDARTAKRLGITPEQVANARAVGVDPLEHVAFADVVNADDAARAEQWLSERRAAMREAEHQKAVEQAKARLL